MAAVAPRRGSPRHCPVTALSSRGPAAAGPWPWPRARLAAHGFTTLDERDAWKLEAGARHVVVRHDSTLVAFALGSAYQLPDGGYHFNLGLLSGTRVSRAIEVDSSGKPVFAIDALTPMYRSFRVADLYSATTY